MTDGRHRPGLVATPPETAVSRVRTPVRAERLRDLTLDLVGIPSPTGDTVEAAAHYGRQLQAAGMEVELWDDFPHTPTVLGRLRGVTPGPTVLFCGHLDTIPMPHASPQVVEDVIFGRGSADMKGGLVCAAEAVGLFAQEGPFRGELAVVAIGLHEAPLGRAEDLRQLLRTGRLRADLAVVCELAGAELVVAHMGQATVRIEISRPGDVVHEVAAAPGTPHPLYAAGAVIGAIEARNSELAADVHPWVGPDSYFLGEVHGGDFFNRYPTACELVGTRRWSPDNTFSAVQREYEELLAPIAARYGCEIDLQLEVVRDAYEIDPQHPLPVALNEAYEEVTGSELAPIGVRKVADAAILQNDGGIPTIYHGPVGDGAHGDVESVPVSELVRTTEVYVALLRNLLAVPAS